MNPRNPFLTLSTISDDAPLDSSFLHQDPEAVERHFQRARYDRFLLPDAIRPAFDLQIIPRQGFRMQSYTDDMTGKTYPSIYAAVSAESLMDVYFDLLAAIGPTVDITLESAHETVGENKTLYFREEMDTPIFQSVLVDFEKYLFSDGCVSVSASHPTELMEVRLDDHKLLVAYADDLTAFEQVLLRNSVYPLPDFRLLTDGEHVHITCDDDLERFQAFAEALSAEVC